MGTFPGRRTCYGIYVKLGRVTCVVFAETCRSQSWVTLLWYCFSLPTAWSIPGYFAPNWQSTWPFWTCYGQERSKQGKVQLFDFFFLLIFQPQTKHLWGYWKSQLWYKKMFLLKILSQFFWAGVVCGFLKDSVSLGQCSMNGVEIWSVCPRVTPIPWDSVLRYSLPYFSLLFYCGYSN